MLSIAYFRLWPFRGRKSRQRGREYQDWGFINNRVDFWISSWYCQLQQNLQSVNSKVQSNLFLPAGLLHRIDWFMDKGEMTGEKLKWLANSEPWIKLQFAAFRAKGRPHSFIIRCTPGKKLHQTTNNKNILAPVESCKHYYGLLHTNFYLITNLKLPFIYGYIP